MVDKETNKIKIKRANSKNIRKEKTKGHKFEKQ